MKRTDAAIALRPFASWPTFLHLHLCYSLPHSAKKIAGHEKGNKSSQREKQEACACSFEERPFRSAQASRYRSEASSSNPGQARRGLPFGDLRSRAPKSIPIADRHDSFRTVHRRAGESGDAVAVSEISKTRGFCLRKPAGSRSGNSPDRIFPLQNEIHSGYEQEDCRRILRRSAANHGAITDLSRSGTQDGQRCARHSLWHSIRDCRRYSREAPGRTAGPHSSHGARENRAGSHADHSGRKVDYVRASVDLAWPARLPGAQAPLHGMQPGENLLFAR